MNDILQQLAIVLEQRKTSDSSISYVASLHEKGLDKILEKVGEEAIETVLAAKNCATDTSAGERDDLIKEVADLWFHCMVLLSHLELHPDQVLEELEKRFNISGLAEKASRANQ